MGNVKVASFLQRCYLLRCSLTREHWRLKVNFPIAFFAAFNMIRIIVTSNEPSSTPKHKKNEIHQSQTNSLK